jgi:deoxyribonuclease IV
MLLGAHIGIANGLAEAIRDGKGIGCECIQIFAKSPQMWNGPPTSPEAANGFREAVRQEGIRATAVHHGYLANLASPKRDMLDRSRRAFVDELGRAELLGVDGLIFHPGAHLGAGPEVGLRTIAESLKWVFETVPSGKVQVLLENAAGQGSALGSTFEELATVLAMVEQPDRVGVALDTCHLFAAGNDFRTEEGYGRLMDQVESVIGRSRVRAFHLNDAKAELGSHLDRHENIGRGQIGQEGFRHLVNDPRWATTPGYLETPLDERVYDRYAEDLRTLRGLIAPPASKPRASTRSAARKRPVSSTVK